SLVELRSAAAQRPATKSATDTSKLHPSAGAHYDRAPTATPARPSKVNHVLSHRRHPALGHLLQPDRRVSRRPGGQLLCRAYPYPAGLPAVPADAAAPPPATTHGRRPSAGRRTAVRHHLHLPVPVLRASERPGGVAVHHLHPPVRRADRQRTATPLQ